MTHNTNILITGGASGIGYATALLVGRSAARTLIICDRAKPDSITERPGWLESCYFDYVQADVREAATMATCLRLLKGTLDTLILCAAVGPVLNQDPVEIVQTNYKAAISNTLACSSLLAEWGSITLVSSTAAFRFSWPQKWRALLDEPYGYPYRDDLWTEISKMSPSQAYSLAKWGILEATRRLACEFGKRKIRVNCVIPGPTKTPMSRPLWQNDVNSWNRIVSESPFQTYNSPEQVASVIAFLANPDATMVDASFIHVDGGWYALHGPANND